MKLLLPLLPALALGLHITYPPKGPLKIPKEKIIKAPVRHIQPPRTTIDPMMLMFLLKGSGGDSSMSKILPFMMMQQSQTGHSNTISPMMLPLLLEEKASDCKLKSASLFSGLSIDDQKKMARGDLFYKLPIAKKASANTEYAKAKATTDASLFSSSVTKLSAKTYSVDNLMDSLDYDFLSCEAKRNKKSSVEKIIPFMMMQSMGMSQMDPMMMLMMFDEGGNMDDLLPIMMMGKTQAAGAMNPMFMALLADDKKTKVDCDAEYYLDRSFKYIQDTTDKDLFTINKESIARNAFDKNEMSTAYTLKDTVTIIKPYTTVAAKTLPAAYIKCLNAATEEGSTKSSMEKLLPMMMMTGGFGQQAGGMDPLMMMLMLKK